MSDSKYYTPPSLVAPLSEEEATRQAADAAALAARRAEVFESIKEAKAKKRKTTVEPKGRSWVGWFVAIVILGVAAYFLGPIIIQPFK